METVHMTKEGTAHLTTYFNLSTIVPASSSSILTTSAIPEGIQNQIEIPLGVLSRQPLVFLDEDYWICSWRPAAGIKAEKAERHHFLPKDWVNKESLSLCAILADGKLLIPSTGELAVITCLGLSDYG